MKHSPSSSGDFALVCWTPGLLDSADWMLNSGRLPLSVCLLDATKNHDFFVFVFLVFVFGGSAAAPRRQTTFRWEFVVGVRITSDTKLRRCRIL